LAKIIHLHAKACVVVVLHVSVMIKLVEELGCNLRIQRVKNDLIIAENIYGYVWEQRPDWTL
jgi:hypothetical protein